MTSKATTPEEYINQLPEDRKEIISKLRTTILKNLPNGFEEQMLYGMLGYVVPHSIYPDGYHVTPKTPLPFINLASQKNHIALYHSGIYAHPPLMEWFKKEFPKHSSLKLDMGKSCIRFKNPSKVPVALIGELVTKMNVNEWIDIYEKEIKKSD